MSIFDGKYKKLLEEEATQFLILCNSDDRNVLLSKSNKKNMQSFTRLAIIAKVLGYHRLFLKILGQIDKHTDYFLQYLDELNENFALLDKWFNDFASNIEIKEIQKLMFDYWEEYKEKIDKENFKLNQLF